MKPRKTLKEAKPKKSSRKDAEEETREVENLKVRRKITRELAIKKDEEEEKRKQ